MKLETLSYFTACGRSVEPPPDLAYNSLAVAVAQFERGTRVTNAATGVQSQDETFAAGESIACQLTDPSLRGVLLFSDGLNVNGSEMVRGLNSVLPNHVVVTGGLGR